ncbi:MAG: LysM peptidoglycan-binding domain-containing M23 family metallopeptidase [Candidatus Omnitrophica bacterium]|nr:LysM peptidoglycan-binding domain-containing M23 family metallopeptidase [Candidatus Omnitrophota bacterium]MBU1925079.1 LysM peptidoglycan-binding domain-containing M23 family metallopeptidase [Candidatus Omnitrophota bacterium]
MNKFTKNTCLIISLLLLCGCAGKSRFIPSREITCMPPAVFEESGIYHTVRKGETLWQISQNYDVDLAKLASVNKINDACKIEIGQKVFIPDNLRKMKKTFSDSSLSVEFVWPCKGQIIYFFNQEKLNVKNPGIDISAKRGLVINAAASGNVIFTSQNMRGYGKTIIIQHQNNFTTVYAYNEEILVKAGDYVKQGQTIARAGSTGRTSQSLLHFELRQNNRPKNPLYYLP